MKRLFFLLFILRSFAVNAMSGPGASAGPYPYLVILVDAPHLDYSNGARLIQTIGKHPADNSKCGDVGHAWIYLHGNINQREIAIEGGHSGELGIVQPKYFQGVMDNVVRGDANPIRYLWEIQHDGFFQRGSGRHQPTCAIYVALSQEQFERICRFIAHYNFKEYSLWGNQCCSFVVQVASLAGLDLSSCQIVISVPSHMIVGNHKFLLRSDPEYAQFTFDSPDLLECHLKEMLRAGKARPALSWYRAHHRHTMSCRFSRAWDTFVAFPGRFFRWLCLLTITICSDKD